MQLRRFVAEHERVGTQTRRVWVPTRQMGTREDKGVTKRLQIRDPDPDAQQFIAIVALSESVYGIE